MQIGIPHEPEIMPGRPMDRWTRRFDSLVERTLHYGALAQRAGCAAFGLDSAPDYAMQRKAHGKRVVPAGRSVNRGHLTTGHTPAVGILAEMAKPDHWFRDLDSLGVSFRHPVADHAGGTRAEMVAHLRPLLDRHREVAALYGKPLYFAVRLPGTPGATMKPWFWDNPGGYDGDEQARFLDAVPAPLWDEPWWMATGGSGTGRTTARGSAATRAATRASPSTASRPPRSCAAGTDARTAADGAAAGIAGAFPPPILAP